MVISTLMALEQAIFLHNIKGQFICVYSINVSSIMVSFKRLDEGTTKSTHRQIAVQLEQHTIADQYPQIAQTKANNKTFWLP